MAAPALPARRRTRERRALRQTNEDRRKVAERVVDFYQRDMDARSVEDERRLQLHAKYRQWTSGKAWPWEGSSDQAIPDLTTQSLRQQDTLVNAVLSTRPAVLAKAVRPDDQEQQDPIDMMLDTQFFIEQSGERALEEMAEAFVNDPAVRVFIPWIREKRKHSDVRVFPGLPENVEDPRDYFERLIEQEFPGLLRRPENEEGWDWRVGADDEIRVRFYTKSDDRIEMVVQQEIIVFNGPRAIVKDYADVLAPPDVANLQIPSPSNPGGAPHVILVDHPTIDEIRRLVKDGFYDLIDLSDTEELEPESPTKEHRQNVVRDQRRTMAGKSDETRSVDDRHKPMTRLLCFDVYDVDGDGVAEDVMWWVLLEKKWLLKAKLLTEMYPSRTPRRPIAEGSYLPVQGRSEGISLLELVEGLHDWLKETIDQMVDAGTLANSPFGFYRPSSGLNPEPIRMFPGDLYPLSNPGQDVNFPNLSNQNQSFGFNTIAVIQQFMERLTLQGDIQSGRVPLGRSSALRTQGSIAMLLQQGEARPERVLRRFFSVVLDVFRWFHTLNQFFLPDEKVFRVMGPLQPGQSPYQRVSRENLRGEYEFDFRANVLNSNKQAFAESLMQVFQIIGSPLTLQTNITSPDGLYRLLRDLASAMGLDQDRYLQAPTPEAGLPRVSAADAFADIAEGKFPNGIPMEPAAQHLEALQEILGRTIEGVDAQGVAQRVPASSLISPAEQGLLGVWIAQVTQRAQQEAAMEAQVQAAAQQQQGPQPGPGRPPETVQGPGGAPPIQGQELLDETLPGARGQEGVA